MSVQFIQTYFDGAKKKLKSGYAVTVQMTLVQNKRNADFIRYATGKLFFMPSTSTTIRGPFGQFTHQTPDLFTNQKTNPADQYRIVDKVVEGETRKILVGDDNLEISISHPQNSTKVMVGLQLIPGEPFINFEAEDESLVLYGGPTPDAPNGDVFLISLGPLTVEKVVA
jgi:hypothetical protein